VSKRTEGLEDPNIDFVMTYEELGAIFDAKEIVPADCEETPLKENISAEARYYGVTGGVAQAVENALAGKKEFKKMALNGLDKKTMLIINAFAKGMGDNFQLLEVMSCKGGCIGGPCTLQPQANVIRPIKNLVAKSPTVPHAFDEPKKPQ
jgi:iron only hydrogenase large subunit-like protein